MGKMPDYHRGVMKLTMSDGANEVMGIEYKRINGLKLGETKLGCKVTRSGE